MRRGTLTIDDFNEIIKIGDAYYADKAMGAEAKRLRRFCMRHIPRQKYRPLKRECPITKRSEAGRHTYCQAKRLSAILATNPSIKNYCFLKRIIKLVV